MQGNDHLIIYHLSLGSVGEIEPLHVLKIK